jgi:hypothetical protein
MRVTFSEIADLLQLNMRDPFLNIPCIHKVRRKKQGIFRNILFTIKLSYIKNLYKNSKTQKAKHLQRSISYYIMPKAVINLPGSGLGGTSVAVLIGSQLYLR